MLLIIKLVYPFQMNVLCNDNADYMLLNSVINVQERDARKVK